MNWQLVLNHRCIHENPDSSNNNNNNNNTHLAELIPLLFFSSLFYLYSAYIFVYPLIYLLTTRSEVNRNEGKEMPMLTVYYQLPNERIIKRPLLRVCQKILWTMCSRMIKESERRAKPPPTQLIIHSNHFTEQLFYSILLYYFDMSYHSYSDYYCGNNFFIVLDTFSIIYCIPNCAYIDW